MSRRERMRKEPRSDRDLDTIPVILVVCEGENTEPKYLRWFERQCRNISVRIEIPKERGTPKRLVEIAKQLKNEALANAVSFKDESYKYKEVWVVSDCDEHPYIPDTVQMARDNDIKLAISNPCFELWIWLHFYSNPGMKNHYQMQKTLKDKLPEYNKSGEFSFDRFFDRYKNSYSITDAIDRARRMLNSAESENDPWRNPSTRMHLLCESIRGNSEFQA